MYPPEFMHDQVMIKPGEDICIQIGINANIPDDLNQIYYIPKVKSSYAIEEVSEPANGNSHLSPLLKTAYDRRAAVLFLIILIHQLSSIETEPSVVSADLYAERAYHYIMANYQKAELLMDIARKLGISSDYLRHIFKDKYGISMKNCIINTQIERAKNLLLHSTSPLKLIADISGFQNERYFCTRFKRIVGITPGEFRKTSSVPSSQVRFD